MKKKKNQKPVKQEIKKAKKFLEYYYMIPEEVEVRRLSGYLHCVDEERVEIWRELNLMEVVLVSDSLIFQDSMESFEDPADLEFLKHHGIKTVYQVSYEEQDQEMAKKILAELLKETGGFLCCDTEDFAPFYRLEDLDKLI